MLTQPVVSDRLHMDLDREAAALLLARSDAGREAGPEIAALAEVCRREGAIKESLDPRGILNPGKG